MLIDDLRIDAPGGSLFVRRWRTAETAQRAPVVLFHDSLGSVDLWRDFPAALCGRSGREVIAYDRLGFGRSDAHPDRLTTDFVATEAEGGFAALRQGLAFDRFVLVGHSVGGGMAVHCAARYPDACVALVTVAAQAFVEDHTIRGIESARGLFSDPAQFARIAKRHGAKGEWVLDAWIGSWLAPEFADWSLDAALAQVRCPLLAIHGADDEFGTTRHPARIDALSGGPARVVILPDTGHVPHRERTTEVLDAVAEFLADLP
ncbi:MAG: alpha/beta fold hydrolase [Rhodocyclaceae bacterium]|nr:alpha/beta fold hydrolase [Rhodocyclaceae bacterium]